MTPDRWGTGGGRTASFSRAELRSSGPWTLPAACEGRRSFPVSFELAAVDDLAQRLRVHPHDPTRLARSTCMEPKAWRCRRTSPSSCVLNWSPAKRWCHASERLRDAGSNGLFFLWPGRGVIAEVERGGTNTNNHDLKDLWKAHLSPDSHHLFLIVPWNNWKADGSARERPFQVVARRIGAFFGDPRREIDVLSAHIFAY